MIFLFHSILLISAFHNIFLTSLIKWQEFPNCCTLEHLNIFLKYWCLTHTLRNSDVTGVECNQGIKIFKSSPSGSKVCKGGWSLSWISPLYQEDFRFILHFRLISNALSLTKIVTTNLYYLFSSFLAFAGVAFAKIIFLIDVRSNNIGNQDNSYIAGIKLASEPNATYALAHTQVFLFKWLVFSFTVLRRYWVFNNSFMILLSQMACYSVALWVGETR